MRGAVISCCLCTIGSAIVAGAQAAPAQAPRAPTIPTIAASSFATEEVRISARHGEGRWLNTGTSEGPARITITYGQPHARGRQIMGKLVPMDSVWRFGANLAPEFRTDVDVTIGGTKIPRGVYTLFLLPSANGWQLIVNKEFGEWGTDYKQSMDFARIPLKVNKLNDAVESLSVYLIPTVDPRGTPPQWPRGVLKIMWEKTELTTDWSVDAL